MDSWLQTIDNLATQYKDVAIARLQAPGKPVMTNPATGQSFTEGQPAPVHSTATIMGMSPVMLGVGVVGLLLVGYLVLKKK